MRTIGLIIIGDEILSGKRQDKHLPKVVSLLGERGLALAWARYLGDRRDHITAALKDAFASGDIVFCCGGIGATPDDHTRQSAAAALGVDLELHPQAHVLILDRMREVALERNEVFDPQRPDNAHRFNMGVFPHGATLIANPYNRIPGFSVGEVHFVPGFPVMAWPMIESVLDQRYGHLRGRHKISERSVIVFGAIEAALTPLMEAVERDAARTQHLDDFGEVLVLALAGEDFVTDDDQTDVHERSMSAGCAGRSRSDAVGGAGAARRKRCSRASAKCANHAAEKMNTSV